jgi:hypothetical protein
MKKTILTTVFCICVPLLIFGSYPDDFNILKDSSKQETGKPVLRVRGAKVFDQNTLLKKSEVLNILSPTPAIAKQYQSGTHLRGARVPMIIGGSVLCAGGIVLMVTGIVNETDDYYYGSYTTYSGTYYAGLAVAVIGELLIDGGIACGFFGKYKIKKSINNYNATVNPTGDTPGFINYQLGLLDDGKIGLKLTF